MLLKEKTDFVNKPEEVWRTEQRNPRSGEKAKYESSTFVEPMIEPRA